MRPIVRLLLLILLSSLALPALALEFDQDLPSPSRLGAALRETPPPVVDGPDQGTIGEDIGEAVGPAGEVTEPAGGPDGQPGECRREQRLKAFRVVSAALELSEGQREAWRELAEALHQQAGPRRAELAQIRSRIAELTGSPDPDPSEIGELMLEARRLREELRLLEQRYREDFANLLDPEQRQRAAFFAQAARVEPILPAFRATHLLPAPHPRRAR